MEGHPLELSNETKPTAPNPDAPLGAPEALPPPSLWRNLGSALRELIETLILTLVIFLVIRFAVQNFRIEGFSMEPNFHDGQYLFVNKLVYMLHPPERGDVVVFLPPNNNSRDFIKRVIGLPGERIEIRSGAVFINGELLKEDYPLNVGSYSTGSIVVPPDEYFVLGDNRNYSSDSHSWGTVSGKKIIGKAWISYWPPQAMGLVPDYTYASGK
ncbi:MAG: signal peptidase I [Chloroflexi bacterium]|nr:signal peptidase I [Chloroflexota bacterium]